MVSKTTFKIKLKDLVGNKALSEVTTVGKLNIKKELSEFIIDKILDDTSNQRSAVTGQQWKQLGWNKGSVAYKKEKSKVASSNANLELTGEMLDALKGEIYRDGVEIGIFNEEQAQKSDNHNKFSAKSKKTGLPQRQFLPRKNEQLRSGILKDVIRLAKSLVDSAPKTQKSRIEFTKLLAAKEAELAEEAINGEDN